MKQTYLVSFQLYNFTKFYNNFTKRDLIHYIYFIYRHRFNLVILVLRCNAIYVFIHDPAMLLI